MGHRRAAALTEPHNLQLADRRQKTNITIRACSRNQFAKSLIRTWEGMNYQELAPHRDVQETVHNDCRPKPHRCANQAAHSNSHAHGLHFLTQDLQSSALNKTTPHGRDVLSCFLQHVHTRTTKCCLYEPLCFKGRGKPNICSRVPC